MRRSRRGFSLVELLAVVGIIAVLMGILVPAIVRARKQAIQIACASNLRQMFGGMMMYLNDYRNTVFWHGADLSIDGMEWYAYGGQSSGNTNTDQMGLFNRFQPRPLNPYVGGNIKIFQCPADNQPWPWSQGVPHWTWVGTSYNFNAEGSLDDDPQTNGLAGIRMTRVRRTSETVFFLDAVIVYPADWHEHNRGNVCFADGNVRFMSMDVVRDDHRYSWGPP